jgi:hypothetical protein
MGVGPAPDSTVVGAEVTDNLAPTGLDRVTKWASTRIARRVVLKGAAASAAAVAFGWLTPQVASATNCSNCGGPCSRSWSCDCSVLYSPNGQWVLYQFCCSCSSGCWCFSAHGYVCDDGSYAENCERCFWC